MADDVGEEKGKRSEKAREKERTERGGSEEKEHVRESAACRYSMPIHIQPGVERHEASRK